MYNPVAGNSVTADRFGAISESHRIAIQQIKKFSLGLKPNYKILDLGVGNGSFLKKLHRERPHAELTGIDVSSEMLKQAQAKLRLNTIEGSAAEAERFLPPHSQDLVLAHFTNACIPLTALFSEANLNCDKNKLERFLLPGRYSVATVFGPVCYQPCPLLVFRKRVQLDGSEKLELIATGSLNSVNPDRIVLKKVFLSSYTCGKIVVI
jgi:SAM-dependent methyltransferase